MILFLLNVWRLTCNVTGYIIDLAVRYPLQFILVLVCCYAFWQKTRYDAIVSEFGAYKANIAHQAELQKVKNDILRKQAEKQVKDLTEIHTHNLEAVKHEYEKTHNIDAITISDLRTKLRDKLEGSSFGVPESTSNPIGNTESERECYAAYSTLESACKITTLDFNAIRSWADTVCQTVGCEAP